MPLSEHPCTVTLLQGLLIAPEPTDEDPMAFPVATDVSCRCDGSGHYYVAGFVGQWDGIPRMFRENPTLRHQGGQVLPPERQNEHGVYQWWI